VARSIDHDGGQPFERDSSLELINADSGPPFASQFIERYRAAQLARNRRLSAWASADRPPSETRTIVWLDSTISRSSFSDRSRPGFLDEAIDPSDRAIGVTLLGFAAGGQPHAGPGLTA